jgi:hypothetical protein
MDKSVIVLMIANVVIIAIVQMDELVIVVTIVDVHQGPRVKLNVTANVLTVW